MFGVGLHNIANIVHRKDSKMKDSVDETCAAAKVQDSKKYVSHWTQRHSGPDRRLRPPVLKRRKGRHVRKQLLDRLRGPGSEQRSALLCLTVCFAVGAAGGCMFAGLLGADTQTRLLDYFGSYFTALRDSGAIRPSLLSTLWEVVRWPLLAFLLGFTALGVVGLPALFCVRSFLLSYAVAVLVRLYGVMGLLTALAVFGVSGFLVLPALFTLGMDAFRSAGSMAVKLLGDSRQAFPPGRGRLLRAGCCGVLLSAAVALQLQLTPVLLSAAIGLLQ